MERPVVAPTDQSSGIGDLDLSGCRCGWQRGGDGICGGGGGWASGGRRLDLTEVPAEAFVVASRGCRGCLAASRRLHRWQRGGGGGMGSLMKVAHPRGCAWSSRGRRWSRGSSVVATTRSRSDDWDGTVEQGAQRGDVPVGGDLRGLGADLRGLSAQVVAQQLEHRCDAAESTESSLGRRSRERDLLLLEVVVEGKTSFPCGRLFVELSTCCLHINCWCGFDLFYGCG
uniref:Uncharacterized protein n=1 Tax=Arundo donax TaxID=35708 RepID=A0A0A9E4F9_ARUDO